MTNPPQPPDLSLEQIRALIAYAEQSARFVESDIEIGRQHGHDPHPASVENVTGYRFMALALSEAYDDELS